MRLAVFTFVILAGLGVVIGHSSKNVANPSVDDRGTTIRVKL
jgi:hypothetical protein